MYSFNSVVRYSEVEPNERLSVSGIIDYFQDCSTFQSEELNVGVDEMMSAGRGWLLSYWQVQINELPYMGTEIVTGTWPYEFDAFFGCRNFIMKDKDDRVLAVANSVWVFVDSHTGRPARLDDRFRKAYELEPRYRDMNYEPRKIKITSQLEAREPFGVRYSDIDTNNHVNNAQYIRMAREYLPKDYEIHQVRAEYRIPALYGDIIYPFIGNAPDGRIQVDLCNADGKTYAVVEWA